MIPDSLLLSIAMLEATLVGAAVLLVVGNALRLALQSRRRRACKASALRQLVRVVEGEDPGSVDDGALHGPPGWLRAEIVTELLPALSGPRRERLLRVAIELGMVSDAERRCGSARWSRRLRGVRVLTLLGTSKESLVGMLDDSHPEVRAGAAEGIADHPTPERVERLLEMLRDSSPLVRFAAKDALLRIGRPATEPLAELLASAPAAGAEDALDIATGLAGPAFLAPALALATSDRAAVRARAARLLGAVGGANATEALTRLLEDPETQPRAAAAESLGRLGHWPASGALAGRLGDPDWSVRRAAALALRDLGAPGLLFLRRALGGEDRYAQDIAHQVLDLPEAADHSLAL